MGTPQAVLDAEVEADRLIAGLANDGTPAPEDTGDEGTPPAGETPPAPEVTDGTPPEPVAPPAPGSPDAAAQLAELQAKYDKLVAQHDTLRGKTYAEVPRVIAENKELKDRIAALEAKLTAQPPTPAPAAPVTGKSAEILASIKEDVNPDVADKIERLARSIAEEIVSNRVEPLAGRVGEISKTAQEQAEERYMSQLGDKVPDWKTYAGTPEYSEFLGMRDELTGMTHYDLATRALEALDAGRMAAVYNRYKALKGIKPADAGEESPAGRVVPKGKEALIAPKATTKTGDRTGGEEKPDWITTSQLEKFNRDMRNMSDEAQEKLQARIDKAIQKGWIIPG